MNFGEIEGKFSTCQKFLNSKRLSIRTEIRGNEEILHEIIASQQPDSKYISHGDTIHSTGNTVNGIVIILWKKW